MDEAKSNLQSLKSRQQAAVAQENLTRRTGSANIDPSRAAVEASQANISTAQISVTAAQERLSQALAGLRLSQANGQKMRDEVEVAKPEVKRQDEDV